MTQPIDPQFIDRLQTAFRERDRDAAGKALEAENVRVIEEVFRAIAYKDFDALGGLLADGVTFETVGSGGPVAACAEGASGWSRRRAETSPRSRTSGRRSSRSWRRATRSFVLDNLMTVVAAFIAIAALKSANPYLSAGTLSLTYRGYILALEATWSRAG